MRRVGLKGRIALAAAVAFATLIPLAGPASAAIIGPDAFGYVADTAAPGLFQDISASGTQILADVDDTNVAVPIALGFPFYGVTYSQVFVSSNGLLTFGSGNDTFGNIDLNVAGTLTQPSIAVLWDDWETQCTATDAVYYEVSGGALIVQWHQVSHFDDCPVTPGNEITFQAVLFADGTFEFRYLDLDNGDTTESFGASATVGIRDASGSAPANGNVLQVSFNAPSLTDGQIIRFTLDQGGPGPGDGGGGDGYGGRRARTALSLRGPDNADAGDQITLHGKLRCKRERCKVNSKVLLFRGNQQIGSTRTDSNGRFSFTTTVPGSGEGHYTAVFEGKRRCRRSTSDVLHVN